MGLTFIKGVKNKGEQKTQRNNYSVKPVSSLPLKPPRRTSNIEVTGDYLSLHLLHGSSIGNSGLPT